MSRQVRVGGNEWQVICDRRIATKVKGNIYKMLVFGDGGTYKKA